MRKISILLILTLLLSGCMKAVTLTTYLFPDCMGIEYENGEFKVSTLITNPLASANLETSTTLFPNIIVVSKTGKTINEALQKLQIEEQQNLSPVHLKSLVLNKNIFEEGNITYDDLLQIFIQNPNFSMKIWTYLTEKPIKDIFAVRTILTSTRYFALLNYPNYKEMNNLCRPINIIEASNNYFSNRVTYLPFLDLTEENILQESVESGKLEKKETIDLNQVCFISSKTKKFSCFKQEEIEGFKWIQGLKDIDISVNDLSVGVKSIKVKRKYSSKKVLINVSLSIAVYDNIKFYSSEEIGELITNKIKEDLEKLKETSIKSNVDIFNVLDYFSRFKNKEIILENETISFNVETSIITQSVFSS